MATLTRWATHPSPFQVEERGSSLSDLFGRRTSATNIWQLQNLWARMAVSTPEKDETVIRHDEVTLKQISLSRTRVKIALTDDLAEQVKRIVGGQ